MSVLASELHLKSVVFHTEVQRNLPIRYDHIWSIWPRTAPHSRALHYTQPIIMLINAPIATKWMTMMKMLHLKINRLLCLKMFLLNYPLTNLKSVSGKCRGEGLYRFTCVLDTLRDGKLTQQLVSLHGGEQWQKEGGWRFGPGCAWISEQQPVCPVAWLHWKYLLSHGVCSVHFWFHLFFSALVELWVW